MVKLECVVSDLDGSLLGPDRKISAEDLATIKKLKQQGIYFFIATGRHPDFVKQVAHEIGIDLPICCCNGGLIFDYAQSAPVMERPIEPRLAKVVMRELDRMELKYIIYTDDAPYFHPESPRLVHWRSENAMNEPQNRFEIKIIDEDFDLDEHNVIKFLIPQSNDEIYFCLRERLTERDRLSFIFSGDGLMDINAAGCSKGDAVEFLAKEYGFNLENTMVLGDNFNDIPMLEVCGIPVCPENAEQGVKDISKHITVHHSQSPLTAAVKALFPDLI